MFLQHKIMKNQLKNTLKLTTLITFIPDLNMSKNFIKYFKKKEHLTK